MRSNDSSFFRANSEHSNSNSTDHHHHPHHDSSHSASESDGLSLSGRATSASQASRGDNTVQKISGDRTISVVRVLLIASLLTVAAIASKIMFLITLNAEERTFQKHLKSYSHYIIDGIVQQLDIQYLVADSIASELSSASQAWPNVTHYNFHHLCSQYRDLSKASSIWYAPLVSRTQQSGWEAYLQSQSDFTQLQQQTQSANNTSQNLLLVVQPIIFKSTGRTKDQGIFKIQQGVAVSDDDGSEGSTLFPIRQAASLDTTQNVDNLIPFNQMSEPSRADALSRLLQQKSAVLTAAFQMTSTDSSIHQQYPQPTSALYFPIMNNIDQSSSDVVGAVTLEFDWLSLLTKSIPTEEHDSTLIIVLENTCGQQFSFEGHGDKARYLGVGDLHDETFPGPYENPTYQQYEDFRIITVDTAASRTILQESQQIDTSHASRFQPAVESEWFAPKHSLCDYRVVVYPTVAFRDEYLTNLPQYYEAAIAMFFLFASAVFIVYDCIAEKRKRRVAESARQNHALVNSLFPKKVRDRLYAATSENRGETSKFLNSIRVRDMHTPRLQLKSYLADNASVGSDNRSKKRRSSSAMTRPVSNLMSGGKLSEPIADLFPNATILFADITGFTSWSSEREPRQVFSLLENLFGAMDKIAHKLGVFKVETVADSYVAATGVPDPQEDHAVIMARFAYICLQRVKELTQSLEANLGPGTGDLSLRIGMHSGPVTAGVLRGEKSRFQLFGDTMNTAARLETTGMRNQVHVSRQTAELLTVAGKERWLEPRKDAVQAKGKGMLTTFWLRLESQNAKSRTSKAEESVSSKDAIKTTQRIQRLIEWNTDLLLSMLKPVVAQRQALVASSSKTPPSGSEHPQVLGCALDEVKEVVCLPKFDVQIAGSLSKDVQLPDVIRKELEDFVTQVARGYESNPFHNFEHASHVCLSVSKLLRRIVNSDDIDYREDSNDAELSKLRDVLSDLHNHTYGISSDALTHFAAVFCALVHDLNHTGVPNNQLAKENPDIAEKYRNQSIAEQRSIDVAWELLMSPGYSNLRACICTTDSEKSRFRDLLVNSVLATDIFDPQMTALRKLRWKKAFHKDSTSESTASSDLEEDMNRKATIVIEHIIQASDVAHTMQHWHVYSRWNKQLFQEMHKAFSCGRSPTNPATNWYRGELWFFDNYVIPLAHKLKDCGVFGVSSDEYLTYALTNREEWERKGADIVATMVSELDAENES